MILDVKTLRRTMAAKGYTIASLARAAELSPTTLSRWINHGTTVRTDTIGRLARALDVDIYDIAKD